MSRCKYSHGIYLAVDGAGNRVSIDEAERHGRGYFCELCHARLNPKKGEVRIHHFAHEKGKRCDPWAQPMSEWHRAWQERFPKESREYVLERDGEQHRADVFLEEVGTVIEFQHSPLSYEDFIKRNDFYTGEGRSVIWLFDVSRAFNDGHIDVFRTDGYGYRVERAPGKWKEADLRWRWANKALNGRTVHDLDRERVKVFLQLGEQSEDMPRPIAEVTESDEGFKECVATFIRAEEFVESVSREQERETAPINEFQQDLMNRHPADYTSMIWENHVSSLVLLRRRDERRLVVAIGNNDDAVRMVLDHARGLHKHYDIVDVIINLQGWTINRHLISEPVGCRDYSGDFYRGRNNPFLVLKLKEDMRGYLNLPPQLRSLVGHGETGRFGVGFRLWACVRWDRRIPTSLTWIPKSADEEWCWPFVPAKGSYVSLVSKFDGDARVTLDARKTFPYDTFLTDMASGNERYIKACKYDKHLHEPPFVVESARNKAWHARGL